MGLPPISSVTVAKLSEEEQKNTEEACELLLNHLEEQNLPFLCCYVFRTDVRGIVCQAFYNEEYKLCFTVLIRGHEMDLDLALVWWWYVYGGPPESERWADVLFCKGLSPPVPLNELFPASIRDRPTLDAVKAWIAQYPEGLPVT